MLADQVARFDALAATWWNPDGPMRPLHRMNPLRVGWIDYFGIKDLVDGLYQLVSIGRIGDRVGHEDRSAIERFSHELATDTI